MVVLRVKNIVGNPDSSSWSQVHHFAGLEREKLAQRGEMVLLLSLRGVTKETGTVLGRELVSRVYEEYYGNLSQSPMERLREVLVKVSKEKPIYLEEKVNFSLLVLVLWREVVYLGIWQRGRIWLFRQGRVEELLRGREGEVKVISGQIQKDDLFLLGTEEFFSQLPLETIKAGLRTNNEEKVVEILTPLVQARPHQGALGAAVVKVREEEGEAQEEEKKEEDKKEGEKGQERKFSFPRYSFSSSLRRRLTLGAATVFLFLFLGILVLGWQKKSQQEKRVRFNQLYSQAEEKLTTALSLRSLERKESLRLAQESLTLINQALALFPEENQGRVLKEKAEKLIGLLGEGERQKPSVFFNLRLLSEEIEGRALWVGEKEIYVLDRKKGRVFSLSWPKKKSTILAVAPELKESWSLVLAGGRVYFLLTQGVSLFQNETLQPVIEFTDEEEVVLMSSWGNNLYLLDKKGKQLWKYSSLGGLKRKKEAWFKEEVGFSWDEVVDFDIDSRIWFLTHRGEVFRYLSGRQENFALKGSFEGEAALLAVARKGDLIVVWDKRGKTVWLWNKQGEWLAKIPLALEEVIDLGITPGGEEVFLLDKTQIYQLDLSSYRESFPLWEKIKGGGR